MQAHNSHLVGGVTKTRIPYEILVAPRDETITTYNRFVDRGIIPTIDADAATFEQAFRDQLGASYPASGWTHVARELRLIELDCGQLPNRERSYAAVHKDLQRVIDALTASAARMAELGSEGPFLMAALNIRNEFDLREDREAVERVASELSRIADNFDRVRPPPRWNASHTRRKRLKLAALLAPLFEYEFAQIARPVGGSTQPPDDQINDWMRFFQMAATVFWGERMTPDRQAILWQATLPPARLSDFAGSISVDEN